MKRKILVLVYFLVIALLLPSVMSACSGGRIPTGTTEEITSTETEAKSTETPTTAPTETQPTEPTTAPATNETEPTETETAGKETEPKETEPEDDDPVNTEKPDDKDIPEAGSSLTVKEAIALAELLGNGVYSDGKYYVSGVVKMIVLPTTGKMIICDDEGNTISIGEAYNEDGTLSFGKMTDKPTTGDEITVYGAIGKSGSTTQMKSVWICAPEAPVETDPQETDPQETDPTETDPTETDPTETDPTETDPTETDTDTDPADTETDTDTAQSETEGTETEPDFELTVEEAAKLGVSMGHNNYTTDKYYVTGTVKRTYANNVVLEDEKGNEITIFGAYNEDGTVKFKDMDVKPVAGDVVTVYGVVGQSNNSPRIKDGWIIEFGAPESDETETENPDAPVNPDTPENPDTPVNPDTPDVPDTPITPPDVENETVIEDGIVYPADPDIETEGEDDAEEDDDDSNQGVVSCHPQWAFDEGYHWSPACDKEHGKDKLPKEAGEKILHELYCTAEDEGDVIVYTYTCMRCEYTTCRMEIPYESNMYIDPTMLGEAVHNFGTAASSTNTVDGFAVTRFTSSDGSGDHVIVYDDNANTLATGKYMIVRIKLGNGRSGFRIAISSTNAYSANSTGDSCVYATVGGVNSGWTTAIIDISKMVEGELGYSASADGEYYLHKAIIYVDGMMKGTSFDIGYVAFCDTLEDAKAFAAADGALYVYDDLMTKPTPSEKLGVVCNHEYTITNDTHTSAECPVCRDPGGEVAHNYLMMIEKNEDGKVIKYGGSCICGSAAPEKNISNDINFFSMPGQLYNRWNTGGLEKTYVRTGSVMSDGKQMFTRVTLQAGASFRVTDESVDYKGDDTAYAVSGGSGRYAVFRIRSFGTDQVMIWIDDGKTPGWKDNQCMGRTGDDVISGEWHTYVIDFATSTYKFYDTMNPDTTELKIGFKMGVLEDVEDPYLDLAYFAICDTWEEVASVAGDETLNYTLWVGSTPIVEVNKQGKCINDHLPKIDTSVSGRLRYYCYVCEKELQTINISSDINYFSAPSQQINNWATSNVPSEGGDCQNVYTDLQGNKAWLTDLRYDENHGVYTRVNLYQGASFYIATTTSSLTNRNDKNDSTKLITDPLAEGEGCGKFVVFKMRSINNGTVSIMITTDTGKNYGWAHRSETADILSGEFHTYVIPIDSVADADANKVRVLIRTDSAQALKGACVDIAYFAIVDDWNEIAEVAGKEKVVYHTSWYDGAALVEKSPSGGCIQHVPIFQSSTNGTTLYDCASCHGKGVVSLSTPTDVNFYSVPGLTYNNWSTGSNKNNSLNRHNAIYYDETDGFMYSKIRMFEGGSFEVSNGTGTPVKDVKECADAIVGGSGKYLVFKIRATGINYLRLLLADGKKSTSGWDGEMRGAPGGTTFEADGQWRVYVVDLEKLASKTYGANDSAVTHVTFGFQGECDAAELDGTECIDFAYFAVCDNWNEVKTVVGNKDKVLYTSWNSNEYDVVLNSDGTAVE